jgi:hypothetical protein
MSRAEFLTGVCQQLLFSPKGDVAGALVTRKGKVVQLTFEPETGAVFTRRCSPGQRVRVLAVVDHSRKATGGAHPVYAFRSFADASGHARKHADVDGRETTITGTVAALHFARHGQPNGVVLRTGEYLHLRPAGMKECGLAVGARVTAVGEVHMTVLGTRMLEASRVNRTRLG